MRTAVLTLLLCLISAAPAAAAEVDLRVAPGGGVVLATAGRSAPVVRPNSWVAHTEPSSAQCTPTPSRFQPGLTTLTRWSSERIQPAWIVPAGTGPVAWKTFSPIPCR